MAHIDLAYHGKIFEALSESLRIRILRLVMERELCVCEIMQVIREPQYKISRHLAVLKKAGLLSDWPEGTWVHYDVNPALPIEWRKILYDMRSVWDKDPEIQEDLQRLKHTSKRQPGVPVTCC